MEAPNSLCLETAASFPGTLEKQEMWEVPAGALEESLAAPPIPVGLLSNSNPW